MKRTGEESNVVSLYMNYSNRLKDFLMKRYGNREFVDEVLQETFCVACEKTAELSIHPCPCGWLYRTAENKARELQRKHWRIQYYELIANFERAQNALVLSEIETKETLRGILSKREYEMLFLKYALKFNFREISIMYGITEEACKKRLHRILFRVQRDMKKI